MIPNIKVGGVPRAPSADDQCNKQVNPKCFLLGPNPLQTLRKCNLFYVPPPPQKKPADGCVGLLFIWQQRRLKCKQRNILCKIGVWLSPTTSEEKMQWYFGQSEMKHSFVDIMIGQVFCMRVPPTIRSLACHFSWKPWLPNVCTCFHPIFLNWNARYVTYSN